MMYDIGYDIVPGNAPRLLLLPSPHRPGHKKYNIIYNHISSPSLIDLNIRNMI